MKIKDERERHKDKDRKMQRSSASYNESVKGKWFCCAVRLGFVQLIFKSNLELALSIILKERELDESKHVMVE